MASRTLYKLSLLKISLFILLLNSYRLGTLASSQEDGSDLHQEETVGHNEEAVAAFESREHQLGRDRRVPHVFVGILARNVAYLLTNFFGGLENLDYPKESMTIW